MPEPKNGRLEVLELVALFLLKTETCDAKNYWEFFLDAMFCLVKIGFETGSRDSISCLLPCVSYCMELKLSMLSWTVWALRTTTTNCRVSFIDLYLVFPTKFRIVFLPHKNTVIWLELLWYYHKVWVCVSPAIEMHEMAIKVANNHQTMMQSQSV